MKVKKHPQRNSYKALILSSVRPLSSLSVFLLASSFPAYAVPQKVTTTPRTFADWCLNKTRESVLTQLTVDLLLQEAKTTDCHQASSLLSTRTELSLVSNQITDLRPLSTLTNLTTLDLSNNSIADLKPLSGLTNLTALDLGSNQIADLLPLSELTNLTALVLSDNQITDLKPLSSLTNLSNLHLSDNPIADLKPLSTLTNLIQLDLYNNQTLTDKTCPVKPESICKFRLK
jgi:internalin A